MTDDELLAVLGQPAPPAQPQQSNECPVAYFLDSRGLLPGKARGIEMSALYRMYAEGSPAPVSPMSFARRVHKLGWKAGKTMFARPLMASSDSAKRLRRWLELNPQPFGWGREFRTRCWGKGGK